MIWEFALYFEKPIVIEETKERIDYDETGFYGHALLMKPQIHLDLIPFLLVAPSERDMILDAFFSNTFLLKGCSSSIHWFLDARLPKSSLLRISTLHIAERALRKGLPGNSDDNVRTLVAFVQWSMNIHFLGLEIREDATYMELWFQLVATTFFKRMIAGVDVRWRGHPTLIEYWEELMYRQYYEKFDVLDGGEMSLQAIMMWRIDNDVLYPPINQVKLSLFNEYYRLKPFTTIPGELTDPQGMRTAHTAGVLLFRHRDQNQCEKHVAEMQRHLESGHYDELEEKAAIHPIVVPPLKERSRRAQRLLKDMEAQTKWAEQQKKKLCEGICSHVHRNVRVQDYHRIKDPRGGFRWTKLRKHQRRP